MRRFDNRDLTGLLSHDSPRIRMLALHALSEGYADDQEILPQVFAAWDRFEPAAAFPEFPLLS